MAANAGLWCLERSTCDVKMQWRWHRMADHAENACFWIQIASSASWIFEGAGVEFPCSGLWTRRSRTIPWGQFLLALQDAPSSSAQLAQNLPVEHSTPLLCQSGADWHEGRVLAWSACRLHTDQVIHRCVELQTDFPCFSQSRSSGSWKETCS